MFRLRHTRFPVQPLVKEDETVHIQRISTDDTTIDSLYQKALSLQSDCYDHKTFIPKGNARPYEMFIRTDTEDPTPAFRFFVAKDKSPVFADRFVGNLTQYSLGQICTKAGVPTNYINKCIKSEKYDLAANNVNTWLHENPSQLLVRMYGDNIRGLLSSRYQPFDTPKVLEHLLNTEGVKDYKIKGFFLDEERFHLRAVSPKRLNVEGEDLFAGIQVDSSDVGRSSLTVMFFIFKQVCTNGLCVARGGGELFRQKHMGIDADEFNSALVAAFEKIPVLTHNAETLIKESRDIKLNHGKKAELDFIADVVRSIMINTKMSETEAQKVVGVMRDKYNETNWGLINAITEVAQEHTLERRLELERIAGNMLTRGRIVA